jgi:cytochrome c oxidase subunit 2
MRFIGDILQMLFGFTLPEQASTTAYLVDDLYNVIMLLNVVGFFGFTAVMIFFVVKYHRSHGNKSAYIPHNALAETIWTVIPTIIFVAIGVWGLMGFYYMEKVPDNAYKINVTGKQWMWTFTYKKDDLEVKVPHIMYVPVNTPIVLDMTATDVLHSFYVPSFRIKRDTVPGMVTRVNFTATKTGDFKIYCTEFCGTDHSRMRATVRVVSKKRFDKWIARQIKEANISDPVELGSRVFANNCATCHSTGPDTIIGPGLEGIFGSNRDFVKEASVIADEAYIRESILSPNAKKVKGFANKQMNAFRGILSDDEIRFVTEYIKTLKK